MSPSLPSLGPGHLRWMEAGRGQERWGGSQCEEEEDCRPPGLEGALLSLEPEGGALGVWGFLPQLAAYPNGDDCVGGGSLSFQTEVCCRME